MDSESSATSIRLAAFLGTLLMMFTIETFLPRRIRTQGRAKRTINNLSLALLGSALIRMVPWLSAFTAATTAARQGWGGLHQVDWPFAIEIVISLVLLDLVIYGQHVASHHIALLWRFHKVHHADRDLDASSGVRFHPLEILFSMFVKCVVVLAAGVPPEGVVLFEIVLSSCAIFNHSNIAIPVGMDRVMRYVIVTPDMHRIHHSVVREETNSNYGFNLPVWDRLFRTYRQSPRGEQQRLELGIAEDWSAEETTGVLSLLRLPFRRGGRD